MVCSYKSYCYMKIVLSGWRASSKSPNENFVCYYCHCVTFHWQWFPSPPYKLFFMASFDFFFFLVVSKNVPFVLSNKLEHCFLVGILAWFCSIIIPHRISTVQLLHTSLLTVLPLTVFIESTKELANTFKAVVPSLMMGPHLLLECKFLEGRALCFGYESYSKYLE